MPYFTNDDLSLFYSENGTGKLLLILPGNTASSACHAGEPDYFGRHYRTVPFDFRCTGKSSRLSPWPTDWWYKCADDAAALVSQLGEQKCIVMGTSGRANIALLLAIRHPELVMGVVVDSATFLCNDGDHPFMWTCPDAFRAASCQFLKRLEQA